MSRLYMTRQALNAVDASRSSASSLDPALSTLSPEDVEILEAIVAKSPEATTFMTVFKAYSEVLQARGLDPGNDVVYYKHLLKLGVVKGSDWGTKWNIVKNQLGLDLSNRTIQPGRRILPSQLSGLPPHDEDVFTLHSHADETETAVDHRHVSGIQFRRPIQLTASIGTHGTESIDDPSEALSRMPAAANPPIPREIMSLRDHILSDASDVSENLDEGPVRSSTPRLPKHRKDRARSPSLRTRIIQGKRQEQPRSHIDDAEAWKKVEHERHIQDADRFRRVSLLSMCFATWTLGLDWIRSTHSQIANARNYIQLRIFFRRWQERNAKIKDVYERATQVANYRMQSSSLNRWRQMTYHKRITLWREEMRNRMSKFKRTKDERILNDAWTKWRQLYRSRQLYAQNVLRRMFRRWRVRLRNVAALELLADGLEETQERRTLETVMEIWSRRIQLHDAERYITHRIARKTLASTFNTWIRAAQDNRYADTHYEAYLIKKIFGMWKQAKESVRALSNRSDKHLRRRDNLLLRAVLRVWIARERGLLLQRVRSTRLVKDALAVWQQRLRQYLALQGTAMGFANQGSTLLLMSTFRTWAQRCEVWKRTLSQGEQHYTATLLYRALLVWRLHLRAKVRMGRRAKMARKYFLERQAWDRWRLAIEESKGRKFLQRWQRQRLKRTFLRWVEMTRWKRHLAKTTDVIQRAVRKRTMRNFLQHWTNRVVSLKLREIDTAEQYERDCMTLAFNKWRDMCHRHAENLSLVNSFQDVKREDALRRTFLKWFAASRKSKTRRIRLAEREQELRLETIWAAWERWRDRFRENMLRDVEYRVIIQNQTNILFHAFLIWKLRSKSVPGIRFYATNLKTKVWERWRAAMPLAMQARKARESDAKKVLTTAFKKWTEAYRTKIALKAIARARYLRLPSPGQKASSSVTPSPQPLRPLLHRPLRSQTSEPALDEEVTARASTPGPFIRRRGISSLLAARPASRAATAENASSRPAAPLSSAGDDGRREQLWNELRGVQIRDGGRAKSR